MDPRYFYDFLYPFQDEVLRRLSSLDTGLYLTGGTAASRGYLKHRFSDDLDLFANDADEFRLWSERAIEALSSGSNWRSEVMLREDRFVRLNLIQDDGSLKLEFVNDVPAHVGGTREHPILGRIDSAENILANEITALVDREEPKDLADIWGFCCLLGLPIEDALEGARSKAAGIFPADLARPRSLECERRRLEARSLDRTSRGVAISNRPGKSRNQASSVEVGSLTGACAGRDSPSSRRHRSGARHDPLRRTDRDRRPGQCVTDVQRGELCHVRESARAVDDESHARSDAHRQRSSLSVVPERP